MPIPNVGGLIVKCWLNAEQTVCSNVIRDSDEDQITYLLRGELEKELERASDSGRVEATFLLDLQKGFPNFEVYDLRTKVARRIVATVAFHPRHVEGKTGGDIGVVLLRPDVQVSLARSEVTVKGEHGRGLLCQAKLFGRNLSWGKLTTPQKTNLPNRLKYFCLLLYRYTEEERRQLHPFVWQTTSEANINQITKWLASGVFPNLKNSQELLRALVRDEVGTDDANVIKTDITPPMRPSLIVRLHWKDGDAPKERVHLRQIMKTHTQQVLVQSR
jgi:hypothetical protein